MKKRLVFGLVSIALLLGITAATGLADPNLADVPRHRHFIQQPDGTLVPVGPQICERPNLQQAFNQFHFNIHHSFIPGTGQIDTLGPQDGAPGLHNRQGAEITPKSCSFTG